MTDDDQPPIRGQMDVFEVIDELRKARAADEAKANVPPTQHRPLTAAEVVAALMKGTR